jgi:hypothetical protein
LLVDRVAKRADDLLPYCCRTAAGAAELNLIA